MSKVKNKSTDVNCSAFQGTGNLERHEVDNQETINNLNNQIDY